jgi:DNA-directed RNA polymerase specialized sigma54-like protein
VAILKEEAGISVSRETVQKVRKSHGIPNSRKRRAKRC